MKTCFSEEKPIKQLGTPPPPFLRKPPVLTKPPFLSNFFMIPLFVQILKIRASLILGVWEEEALNVNPLIARAALI